MSQSPDLSIIIVNWNSVHFLAKCIESIYANTRDLDFEIIVVDNASFDGSQELVAETFPGVRFIQNPYNEGFAKANNRAFHLSRGRYILFLNPDTEVLGTALQTMIHFLEMTPNAGMVGPKLLNSDLTIQKTSIMRFPSIVNEALDVDYLHHTFPSCRLWDISPLYERGAAVGVQVEAISGACVMVRRSVFEEVGLFETRYFMFSEDLDLCYKVRQAKWRTYHYGCARVIHHGGGSTASAPNGFSAVMIQTSHVEFLRIHRGRLAAFSYLGAMAFLSAVRLAALGFFLIVTLGMYRRKKLLMSMSKWVTVFRWATNLGRNFPELMSQDSFTKDAERTTGPSPEKQQMLLGTTERTKSRID